MPVPALPSVPAPEMSAASVSVSVKLATIAPSLTIAGVAIAPLSPPVPRLSVLPVPMLVPPAAFTTPPAATLRVPIVVAVWPITRPPVAVRVEPDPVTVMNDVPGP